MPVPLLHMFCTQAAADDSGLLQTMQEHVYSPRRTVESAGPHMGDSPPHRGGSPSPDDMSADGLSSDSPGFDSPGFDSPGFDSPRSAGTSPDVPSPDVLNSGEDRTPVVVVDATRPRQTIDGFGASVTEASAYLWTHTVHDRDAMIRDLFDPECGIGLSMLRQPVGPSDHVTRPYSLLRRLPDRRLQSLDFREEGRRMLPMLRAAARAAHGRALRIIVSAWSAPWWMKTNFSVFGQWPVWPHMTGSLRRSCYDVYARYLAAFAGYYQSQGFDVFGITPVNEPDNPQGYWPSMAMTPRQQGLFITRYLAPRLREQGLGCVNIMCWDHNYSTDRYPDGRFVAELYRQDAVRAHIAGSAWHYYGGSSTTMDAIHRWWPQQGIWVTEASGGDWGPRNWRAALLQMSERVIAMLRHWAQSVVLWNIALDERGGPDYYYRHDALGHSLNRGLLTVRDDGSYRPNADYYVIGHFSTYVPVGSRVIPSSTRGTDAAGLHHVAFLTPGGQRVLVLANSGEHPLRLVVEERGRQWELTLPALSLNTALWAH